jgi:dTDP-4-amino-4,6-dideoxygalactose transaminase
MINDMIKFLDLYKQYLSIKQQIDKSIEKVINSSSFMGGEELKRFEQAFARFQRVKHCIGVGNGTDALEIAIEALGIDKNSEIIVPANSFIASSEAVTRAGCKVVFCDCHKENYTISIESIKKKLTKKTKAIMAVHLYGHPCDMDELNKLASENNLFLIEDCAQAHGAEYKAQPVGGLGDIGAFSFYPGKNLGAYGDGGAVVVNDDSIAEKCRMLANHGSKEKYKHEFEGRNSRLDNVQAAILNVKLEYLEIWNTTRIKLADYYIENIKNIPEIILPKREVWAKQVYHLFVIRTDERDELKEYLTINGIQTGIHYPIPLPKLKAYEYLKQADENMFANTIGDKLLSLPMGEHLEIKDIDYIISTIRKYFKRSAL